MSDDVNKDIQKAIQDAKNNGNGNSPIKSVSIPAPKMLKHSLDQEGIVIPSPAIREDSLG